MKERYIEKMKSLNRAKYEVTPEAIRTDGGHAWLLVVDHDINSVSAAEQVYICLKCDTKRMRHGLIKRGYTLSGPCVEDYEKMVEAIKI